MNTTFKMICFFFLCSALVFSCSSDKKVNSEPVEVEMSGLVNELSFIDSIEMQVELARKNVLIPGMKNENIDNDSVVYDFSSNNNYTIISSCKLVGSEGSRSEIIYYKNTPILLSYEVFNGESCWLNADVKYDELNYFSNGKLKETIVETGTKTIKWEENKSSYAHKLLSLFEKQEEIN